MPFLNNKANLLRSLLHNRYVLGNFLINSACDSFLSISDTTLLDCDDDAIIDLILSINLFSGGFFINLHDFFINL